MTDEDKRSLIVDYYCVEFPEIAGVMLHMDCVSIMMSEGVLGITDKGMIVDTRDYNDSISVSTSLIQSIIKEVERVKTL